jgi:RND superfamily putative drug exporter
VGSLGRLVARRAGPIALIWLVVAAVGYSAAVGGLFGDSLFDRLTTGDLEFPSESTEGRDLLVDNAPTGPTYQLVLDQVDPDSAEVTAALQSLTQDLAERDDVAAVTDPSVAGPAFVADDGTAVLVAVSLAPDLSESRQDGAAEAVVDRLRRVEDDVPGSTGSVTGTSLVVEDITSQVETDLRTGELVALPLSLLIMVVIFGGFAAASVPITGAIASIAGGLGSLLLFSSVLELDASVVNIVTVLGLGLCIDYSLLVVSRYREEVGVDHDLDDIPDAHAREHAMAVTMSTAGRTVLFSAVTVAIAVSGLLLFDVDIIAAVGLAALSVVLVALLVALTLVPALLVLMTRWVSRRGLLSRLPVLGRIAHAFGDAPPADGAFSALARVVQRRPWVVAGAVTAILVVLAVPSLRMVLVSSDIELLPEDAEQRRVVEQIQSSFPAGASPPVVVVADASPEQLDAFGAQIAEIDGVTSVGPAREQGEVSVAEVVTATDEQDPQTRRVVADIRADRPAFDIWVTGQAASLADFTDSIRADAPLALGWLALATVVLLFLLTGSVLIPIKALVMIVLSLGATFGALVWIFQDGRGESVLGYTSVGGIEAVIPILVFAFAFGLSMDYEVFLLSRIKEFHDAGLDNDEAVRAGLQRTGRVITSAALIIVVVFAGFVVGDLLVIKQTGVALAIAVTIDATLVRILLVPATMTLMGTWNWWAPGPLRRLHEKVGVSEQGGGTETPPDSTTPDDDGSGRRRSRAPTSNGAIAADEVADALALLELYSQSASQQGRRGRRAAPPAKDESANQRADDTGSDDTSTDDTGTDDTGTDDTGTEDAGRSGPGHAPAD